MRNYEDQSWDSDYYETGSTKPPKSHAGLIAVLLIAMVVYIGGCTAFVRLRAAWRDQPPAETAAPTISAHAEAAQPEIIPTEAAALPEMIAEDTGSYAMALETTPLSVENIRQEGGLSLQEIYVKTIDSVVSITSESRSGTSTGTGVILSENGYIVTNCHVVEGGTAFTVLLSDGRELDATAVGMDTISDLAVLQIHGENLTAAEFGDSSVLRVGDSVVAIGDPLGIRLRGTMTDGIISAINRDMVTEGRTMTLIQTNAALNSGNSGGPLLNCYGQVIGINTMKISQSYGYTPVEGLGFAIPSTTVKEIVDQLIAQGYVSGRPDLGFDCETVSSFYQLYYRLPSGVYVAELPEDSEAARIGICQGDILLTFNGQRIHNMDDLNTALYACQAGDTADLVMYRRGEQFSFRLTLSEATG